MSDRRKWYILPSLFYMAVVATSIARAQSSIDPVHKYAWGENIGWTNWRDADSGNQGVIVAGTFMSGFIWGENVGWINVGDGTPADGVHYANSTGLDFGVNIDEMGDLYGFGWGENVGWVNFDTRDKGDERARIDCDLDPMRLWGFVWGENIGWINLNDFIHYIAGDFEGACFAPCGDWDADGDIDLIDFESFGFCLNQGGPNDPVPPICRDFDCDADSDVDLVDFATFQVSFTGTLP